MTSLNDKILHLPEYQVLGVKQEEPAPVEKSYCVDLSTFWED
ncbi:hypothetical protein [Billgrantia desiderata]|nr:hypothetical protein [Halomonas desiderata]